MDLKKIAKMQIGGPKYPDKKRINLYQREVKKGAVAGQIVTLAAFLVFLSSYSSILFLMEFQRPLILSGKLVRVMTDTNMDIDFLLSLGENDYVMTVSATGNFARAVMPVITQLKAYKALMTTARISELEVPYDKVYHLSANDYSNVKSVYSKYGMEYVFDNLYSTYVRRYGTIIKNTK